MLQSNCELTILVKDRAIPHYEHDGQTFVEGRAGSPYEIQLHNRNPFRIEAVLSVDGLSVTDGKPAGQHSTGYCIAAFGSARIPGWTLDRSAAAAFQFSGKGRSYEAAATGVPVNAGVIGALIYREQPPATPNYLSTYTTTVPVYPSYTTCNATSANMVSSNAGMNGDVGMQTRGITCATAANPALATTAYAANAESLAAQNYVQTLGTAFGDSTAFATQPVAFQRGPQVAMMVLYYDDRRGLLRRGVVLERARAKPAAPQAFPAMTGGCTPPPGWTR